MKKLPPVLIGAFAGSVLGITVVFAMPIAPHIFPDVQQGQYYSDAVTKASNEGWVTGYSNGNFGPNDTVTRAQLVTILTRYNQKIEQDTGNLRTILCNNKTNATNNIKVDFDSADAKQNYEKTLKSFCEEPPSLPPIGCQKEYDPKTGTTTAGICI